MKWMWSPASSPGYVWSFSGSDKHRQQKEAVYKRYTNQIFAENELATAWFVETFPASIQAHVSTFLHSSTAVYLEHLEIRIHHPNLHEIRTYFNMWRGYRLLRMIGYL